MTMQIYDSAAHTGLFDILGQAFDALNKLNTARQTTIPPEVADILSQFRSYPNSAQPAWMQAMERLPAGLSAWQSNQVLAQQIRQNCQNLVIQWAAEQTPQPDTTLTTALKYLLGQMLSGGWYVTANAITLAVVPAGGNHGDPALATSPLRGDGAVAEHSLAETITAVVTSDASATNPTLTFTGQPAQRDRLAADWPLGSGIAPAVGAVYSGNSLLSNGSFDAASGLDANLPDQWILQVGTSGTSLLLTPVPVFTITIANTPTSGTWEIDWQNAAGITRSTLPLAYNATAVQSALRTIRGLEQVTVTSTGTSPDFIHTITMTGVPGEPSLFTVVNNLLGSTSPPFPTITPAVVTAGSVGAYRGRALELLSVGSSPDLTALYQPLTLSVDRVYFVHVRLRASGAIAAGQLRIELVDGINGSVISDDAGNANQLLITAATIPTGSHAAYTASFRLPKAAQQPVYLRLRVATAFTAGCSVFVDEMVLVQGTQLYTGGPFVAVFSSTTAAVAGDQWTLTVTNDRAGKLQEWFNRVFGMAELGLLLPVSGGTSGLIPEAVIA
jgi:hypothetical protein